jgi:hypothetical protein
VVAAQDIGRRQAYGSRGQGFELNVWWLVVARDDRRNSWRVVTWL